MRCGGNAAAAEGEVEHSRRYRDGRERHGNGGEYPVGAPLQAIGEEPGQRDLPRPEAAEVQPGWGPRVPGAVEGRREHHPIPIEEEAKADDPETVNGVSRGHGLGGED